MINMMYLVLTAILALNVSQEVLKAFVLVNEGLETTVDNFMKKNEKLHSDFDKAKAIDSKKVLPFWNRARQARDLSAEMTSYIKNLKVSLMKETEGLPQAVADTISLASVRKLDNYDTPTNLLIGNSEDGSGGLSRKLKEKIRGFREQMLNLLSDEDKLNAKIGLLTEDRPHEDGLTSWEMRNFYHTPLAAAVTLLSKLQNDVQNAEYQVVNRLYQSVGEKDIRFDTIAAKVIAPSNYVLLGDTYRSEIFIAGFSTTQNPEVILGDIDPVTGELVASSDTVPTLRGMGMYSVKTTNEGIHEYNGHVKVTTPDGDIKSYPFESQYIVARPSLVVSPTKMNVLYKGVDNPVSISVPGVASENIIASLTGGALRQVSNGGYIAKLNNSAPSGVEIRVSVRLSSGEVRSMGAMPFRVKRLPKPYAKIGQVNASGRMRKELLKAHGKIIVEYSPDFMFNLTARVVSYRMTVIRGSFVTDIDVRGGRFNREIKDVLDRLRRGDRVIFEWIKAKGDDDHVHELNPIYVVII